MFSHSELWVVPPSSHSAWFARLDWYLNWQMSKGLAHRPFRVAPEIERLANEYQIPIPFAQLADPGPLLISSKGLVPADKCLVVPYSGDMGAWFAKIAASASSLGVMSVQIFLPAGQTVSAAEAAWRGIKTDMTVMFIADQEESK